MNKITDENLTWKENCKMAISFQCLRLYVIIVFFESNFSRALICIVDVCLILNEIFLFIKNINNDNKFPQTPYFKIISLKKIFIYLIFIPLNVYNVKINKENN